MNNQYKNIAKTLPHSMEPLTNDANHPTLEEAVNYINNIDFSSIAEKLCSADPLLCRKWSPAEAEVALQYYKNFLFLNKKYLDEFPIIPPMLEVDEIWHHHILDTRQYINDCNQIFGYYFHHHPYFGTRNHADTANLDTAFQLTQKLHESEFGSKMLNIWSAEREL